MTHWSSVEFAELTVRPRKAQDFLPFLSDFLVAWDFTMCGVAGLTALSFYCRYVLGQTLGFSASGPFWRDIVFGSLIAALALRNPTGLMPRPERSLGKFVLLAESRCFVIFVALIAVGMATRATDDLARLWLVSWLALFSVTVAVTRILCGIYLRYLNEHGCLRESIAIVGSSDISDRLAARVAEEADVVGMFCSPSIHDRAFDDDDDMASLIELSRAGNVDSIILALNHNQPLNIASVIQRLKAFPVQVAICPDDGWSDTDAPQMRLLGGLPMAVVADRPLKRWDLLIKTLLDKIGALILLCVLAPLLLAIALAVGTTSPGPIIFRQRRQGWCGRDFIVLKFRTMYVEPASSFQFFQTLRNDSRCTRAGRLLRQCSLDELPQLWNVLRGDMSLVGPRPHVDDLHKVDRAGRDIVAEYAQRNRVKPGITGWAQVHGARGATATLDQLRRRVDYDLFYIDNWSLWLDIKILLLTPFALVGDNAF